MNILELSRASRIGLAKLRRLESDGYLTGLDDPDPILAPMLHYIARKGQLTVEHLVALIESPELVAELGRYTDRARSQLAELGTMAPAPQRIAAEISGAAAGEPEAVAAVLEWAQGHLRHASAPVTHAWLAVPLLAAVPSNLRDYEAPRLRRVMLNLRRHKDFAGWWHVEGEGSKRVTYYHCPIDAFDL